MEVPRQAKFDAPAKDEVFDLLSNHRRRYTVHYLKDAEGAVKLSELAEQVAAWEQDKARSALTSSERKRVYTSLQQTHIPRLAEAGMITVENDVIALSEGAAELEVYMDIVPEGSIPWGVYYLGLSILSGIVLAGVWSGLVPTDPIPELGWAAIILLAFLSSSIANVIHNRRFRLGATERPP